jgi:hypothetical protein
VGVEQPVLDKVPLVTLGRYIKLFIVRLTFFSLHVILVRTGGV